MPVRDAAGVVELLIAKHAMLFCVEEEAAPHSNEGSAPLANANVNVNVDVAPAPAPAKEGLQAVHRRHGAPRRELGAYIRF